MIRRRRILLPPPDPERVVSLAEAININPVLAGILVQRGIDTFEKAKSFFRPSLDELHDPFLMKDMGKAVARLKEAFERGERILIYGDYDVDGTTSVAMTYDFIKNVYSDIEFYIPDRDKEGYGISQQGIDFAVEYGFKLVISLDCGIKSEELIAQAAERGVDFIVCDHHLPGDRLPPAVAVLDPKRSDCLYPYKELSGCGVGFKLLHAYCLRNDISFETLRPYLDLVAVSICADLVPLTGENRILTYHGIKQFNEQPRLGLEALKKTGGLKDTCEVSDIVFGIAPRINAAGRIAHAHAAVELLLSENLSEADTLAGRINEKNILRRKFDETITEEAIAMIEANEVEKKAKTTVLFKKDWHKGVIGIVASRCIERYYRPTVILTESHGKATGSARSVASFDVYEAIVECSDLLERFGGHMYAAGLTLKSDNVPAFREKFEQVVAAKIREEQLIPLIEADTVLPFCRINEKFYNVLKQIAPFGPGNMQPVFLAQNVYYEGTPEILKERHLKMRLRQEDSNVFEAIGFDMAYAAEELEAGVLFDICFQIKENQFNGNKKLQLYLKDIRCS